MLVFSRNVRRRDKACLVSTFPNHFIANHQLIFKEFSYDGANFE
jgi:hypothetical protein